jgi:hypothetical protein
MQSIALNEIVNCRKKLEFEILKVEARIPIDRLKDEVSAILTEFRTVNKDGYLKYSGIGLQYANPADPLYDSVEQTVFFPIDAAATVHRSNSERDFVHKNILAARLNFLFETFKGIDLYRGRILCARPGHIHARHTDGRLSCRLHIPVITNDNAIMHLNKSAYHMKADGSAYLCNTSLPHHFENLGDTERVHIIFVL